MYKVVEGYNIGVVPNAFPIRAALVLIIKHITLVYFLDLYPILKRPGLGDILISTNFYLKKIVFHTTKVYLNEST